MSHQAKRRIYEQFARLGKALASPQRLELLDLLAQGERSVEALARAAELSIANASQHLQVLHAARLVDSRKQGQRVFYRLADRSVEALWHTVRRTAERRLAELEDVAREYLTGREEYAPIPRGELLARLEAGTVTLIDVRPVEEYEQAHIPGAISVPVGEVKRWARQAPLRKHVVAYCRGPYCVYALQAVAEMRKRGLTAMHSEDGVSEWRVAGLPLETAAREA